MLPSDPTRKARILIIDDEAAQRSAVARMVERWGFVADTASGGAEALAKLQESHFDAMVTDLMMPGMDGMELLRRLKEDDSSAPAIIVLTSYGNIDTAISIGSSANTSCHCFTSFAPLLMR